jgi:tryptophanyl-tRNA synthetase
MAAASDDASLYFIADYHSLTTPPAPTDLAHWTRSVAATWLAAGLDPDRTVFYRQSDVPETFELAWVLSCVTGKGLMNRAHAYKAARDRNISAGEDPDAGVSNGLFNYPVLMAADILVMEADLVPVGRDQLQHVEIAADAAGSFNHVYGAGYRFPVPTAVVPPETTGHTLPGLDGRKMSKSYQNTIPLFLPAPQLKKLVRRIPTDSTPVEAPKDPDSSAVFQILAQFADADTLTDTRKRLEAGGVGWGELKAQLGEVLEDRLAPMRARYEELMTPASELDEVLARGGAWARERASRVLSDVRRAVGVGR